MPLRDHVVGHRRPSSDKFRRTLMTRLQQASRSSPAPTYREPPKATVGNTSPGEHGRCDRPRRHETQAQASQPDRQCGDGGDPGLRQAPRCCSGGQGVFARRADHHPETAADRKRRSSGAGRVSPEGRRGEHPETRGQARFRLRDRALRIGKQAQGRDRRGADRGREGAGRRPSQPGRAAE